MAEANEKTTKPSYHASIISSPIIKKFSSDFHTQQSFTIENFIIILLDANLNLNTNDNNSLIIRFQHLVNLILSFHDPDQCIDFISDIKNEKIFLIVTGSLGQNIVPLINNFHQIDSIYVYCSNKSNHEKWANKEKKIKGIFTKFEPIYDALRRDIRQCEDYLIPFNILSSTYNENENLNLSDQLFIYTQLMKEILFEIEYQPNTKLDFTNFCSLIYQYNNYQLNLIKEFRNNYQQTSSIWWYTRECFIYSILNKAFRIQNMDILIKMVFFIRDIHQEIQRLHTKLNKQNHLIVYRGQCISEEDFQKILDNQNGFLSFNNFLITTTDKNLSLTYARSTRNNHELIGVLFQIEIDRTKSLFTPLDKISYYSESENEILFSTHTIFRIHTIHQIENGLWQIELRLTANEDEQLKQIKEFVRKEIESKNGSERLDVLRTKLQMLDGSKIINEPQLTEMEIDLPVEENTHHEEVNPLMTIDEQPTDPLSITSDQ